MTKEDYERMVSTARWLGQNIADAAVDAADRKQDSAGRSRGVFFRLRKTRSTQDFLDELARLQLRYPSLNVPKDGLDPVLFNHETFEEFRGFCVVAALSRFQWKTKPKDQPTKPNENKEN